MNKSGLTSHDWWIARELRKRAFTLRVQANLILGGVFAFLGGGVYLVIFILPEIKAADLIVAEQTRIKVQQIRFQEKFGQRLDSIVDGRYWLKTDKPDEEEGLNADKKTGFFVEIGTSILTITNGEKYQTSSSVRLQHDERVATVALSAGGNTGLVVGRKGSVFMITDGGQDSKWSDVRLKDKEHVAAAAFGARWTQDRTGCGLQRLDLHDNGRRAALGTSELEAE